MKKIWLAVNRSGKERVFNKKPERVWGRRWGNPYAEDAKKITLPKGTIKKLIGKELTWNDEPCEYIGYN